MSSLKSYMVTYIVNQPASHRLSSTIDNSNNIFVYAANSEEATEQAGCMLENNGHQEYLIFNVKRLS